MIIITVGEVVGIVVHENVMKADADVIVQPYVEVVLLVRHDHADGRLIARMRKRLRFE